MNKDLEKGLLSVMASSDRPDIILETEDGPVAVCPYIEVKAHMANESGAQNRMLVSAKSLKGNVFEASVPYTAFSSTKGFNAFLDEIAEFGFVMYETKKSFTDHLRKMLMTQTINSENQVSIVNQPGWFNDNGFLVNNTIHSSTKTARAILVGEKVDGTFKITDEVKTSGTLEDWQNSILGPCRYNDLFMFSIFFSFYPLLLEPCGIVTGTIFHILADTSKGKTTALRLSMSVLGRPDDLMESWKKTDNAIEGRCEFSNHLPMYLDEIHLADKTFADSVYMIANGEGKGRMTTSATLQRTKRWKTAVMSTGEKSFEQVKRLRGVSDATQGGQTVRFLEIPGDAGKGMGNISYVPDRFDSPKDYADYLIKATGECYGAAMQEYINFATEIGKTGVNDRYHKHLKDFIRRTDSDKVNARVTAAFGGIYAGAMMALEAGVLNITEEEVFGPIDEVFNRYRVYFKNNVEQSNGSAVNSAVISEWDDFVNSVGEHQFKGYALTIYNTVKPDAPKNMYVKTAWGEKILSTLSGKVELRLKQAVLKHVFPNSNISQVVQAMSEKGWVIHRTDESHMTSQEGIYRSTVKGSTRNCLILDFDKMVNKADLDKESALEFETFDGKKHF